MIDPNARDGEFAPPAPLDEEALLKQKLRTALFAHKAQGEKYTHFEAAKEFKISGPQAAKLLKEIKTELPGGAPQKSAPGNLLDQGKKLLPAPGKKMSKQEAEAALDPLLDGLEGIFRDMDQYLWARLVKAGMDSQEYPIWSNLERGDKDFEKMCNTFVKWAQKNEYVASGVRGVVEASDYILVGSIMLPRIKQTVDTMRKTRTIHKSRMQRARESANGGGSHE